MLLIALTMGVESRLVFPDVAECSVTICIGAIIPLGSLACHTMVHARTTATIQASIYDKVGIVTLLFYYGEPITEPPVQV